MDVIRVVQVLLRRWAVVLPVVLLGIAATVLVATTLPDEYTATGTLIVVDRSGGAGEVTPGILAEALQDGAVRDTVAGVTGSGSYAVSADEGGILRVSARGAVADQAAATANTVLEQIPGVLDARQQASGGAATSADIEVLNRATASSVTADEDGLLVASASARLVGAGGTAVGGERASRLLASALDSTTVREQVIAAGGLGDYGVSSSRDLPTIGISAVGSDSGSASSTVELVGQQASAQLAELLQLQGSSASVSVEPLVNSGGVTVDSTGVLRSVVALLALTAAVGVAAAFAVEGVAEHRGKSPSRRSRTSPDGDARRQAEPRRAAAAQGDGGDRADGSPAAEPAAEEQDRFESFDDTAAEDSPGATDPRRRADPEPESDPFADLTRIR